MKYSAIEEMFFGKRGHIDYVKLNKASKELSEEKSAFLANRRKAERR